jgi:hypothetical protein
LGHSVGSVQFTETDCIISVKDLNTKEKLISGGITLKNRSVNFLDVEKTITNVTGWFVYSVSIEFGYCLRIT